MRCDCRISAHQPPNLKRERFSAPVWIAGVVGVTLFFAVCSLLLSGFCCGFGMAVALDTPP
jgi:hypothetical protein